MSITLRQLTDMFHRLPDPMKDREICWLDLTYISEEELQEMETRLQAGELEVPNLCLGKPDEASDTRTT